MTHYYYRYSYELVYWKVTAYQTHLRSWELPRTLIILLNNFGAKVCLTMGTAKNDIFCCKLLMINVTGKCVTIYYILWMIMTESRYELVRIFGKFQLVFGNCFKIILVPEGSIMAEIARNNSNLKCITCQ